MEITSEIIKKNNSIKQDSLIEDLKKFHEENIKNCDYKNFYRKLSEFEYQSLSNRIINNLFVIEKDMNNVIPMAYFISMFPKEIFSELHSTFDSKLSHLANNLVITIDQIVRGSANSDVDSLCEAFDNFNSLFKLWISQDEIGRIDDKMNEFIDLSKIYRLKKKKGLNDKKTKCDMIDIMDNMQIINDVFMVKNLLSIYDIILKIDLVCLHFWNRILILLEIKRDNVIVVLVSELRIQLLPLLKKPSDKKKLYYDVDIENIINDFRCDKFDLYCLTEILNVFDKSLKSIDKKYEKHHNYYASLINKIKLNTNGSNNINNLSGNMTVLIFKYFFDVVNSIN